MTTLVCVPYFGVPDLVQRCADSVLAQTDHDIALVVIGDGEEPPVRSKDSRLEVFTVPENRGPYFVQQVALQASPFEWYSPVGADDWVEPEHVEQLAAVGGDAVLPGVVWFHDMHGRVTAHEGAYEVGRFRTSRLLEVGGHNPAERIGQDTLLIRILRMTGPVGYATRPTYHRVKRPGSLMTSPETGRGSRARNAMRRRNREVVAACSGMSVERVRRYRTRIIPARLRDEVSEQALKLGDLLG